MYFQWETYCASADTSVEKTVTDKGTHDTPQRILQENMYNSQKGAWPGSRDLFFLNFGTPSISPERVKLGTPNLARITILRSTKQKCKIGSKGAWPGSRDLLF